MPGVDDYGVLPGSTSAFKRFWTPGRLLGVFVAVNLINYVDRYAIAGMTNELGAFVEKDLDTTKPDSYIGMTQSSFIAGYAVASLVFGHLVHYFHPFRLMAVGLMCWCGAVLLTGASPHLWVMVVARVISGVGEASFQCIVPPYIDDQAPPEKRGLWLALFFMAIPVGAAIGFGYGAVMATSGPNGWRHAYYIEAFAMLPLAVLVFFLPYSIRGGGDADSDVGDSNVVMPADFSVNDGGDKLSGAGLDDGSAAKVHRESSVSTRMRRASIPAVHAKPTVYEEFMTVVSSKSFLATSLGYAAYTFVTSGFATWGAKILLKVDMFQSETKASLVFGAIVSVTGAVGTPIGGVLLDKYQNTLHKARERVLNSKGVIVPEDTIDDAGTIVDKLMASTLHLTIYAIVGSVLCFFAAIFVSSEALFFIFISLGCLALFASTSATNLAIMSSVPASNRAFAIGINTILIHALGDVPSPIIIGWLLDSVPADSALVYLNLWLAWVVFFWAMSHVLARRARARYFTVATSTLLGGTGAIEDADDGYVAM